MKVLVIRFSAMGDIALSVPVLARAIALNPNVEFTVLTKKRFENLFDSIPASKIIGIDFEQQYKGLLGLFRLASQLRKLKFDLVIDLHDVTRSKILCMLLNCRIITFDKARKEKLEFIKNKSQPVTHTMERYHDAFKKANLKIDQAYEIPVFTAFDRKENAIGFAPFAAHSAKSLRQNQVSEIVSALEKRTDKKIYLFGSKGQFDFLTLNSERIIDTTSWTFTEQLQAISRLEQMIAVDSVNMHLAALQGIPVISIWGATHPDLGFHPYPSTKHEIILSNLSCNPCSVFGDKKCTHVDQYACIKYVHFDQLAPYIGYSA